MALVAATTSMAPAPEVDDFATLCEVETAVVAKMQGDERGGFDLCEQLSHGWAWAQSFGSTAAAARGAHEYFSEPFGSQGLGLAVRGFARWPAFVTAEARRLGAAGAPQSAGLLPEIGCAWAALGAALVVWDYRRGDDFAVYEGLRDAVSAVCLAPPKPRVFVDAVKDVLVVATPSDVSLLALVFEPDANQPPGARGRLRVLPTEFGATTADLDGATFAGAAASRDGRVFFAASDGFVHEFEYAARESVLGRVARMVLPGGNPPAPPPPPPNPDAPKKRPPPAGYEGFSAAKCARRDPSAVRRLATALLPPFARPEWLLHPMRFLGVDGAGKDGLVDVVVDDARGALYALSARGVLGVYDLGKRGRDLRHVGSARVADAAKLWSAAHSARDTTAPSPQLFEPAARGDAKVVAVHVVSPLESATVHCVCVDDAGFRFYFSTTALKSGLGARVDAAASAALPPPTADGADDALRPRALTLVHVRAPPPAALWDGARRARAAGRRREDQVSAPPSTDARELYGAKVGASFYGNGVFVVAKASGRDADRVLECAVDARDAPRGAAAKPAEPGPSPGGGFFFGRGSAPTPSPARAPSPVSAGGDGPKYALREAVSELVDGRGDDGSPASRLVPKVWALGEACDRGGIAAKLRALAALSRTPAQRDARPYDRLVAPLAAREGDAFVAAERKRRRAAAVAAGKGKDLDDDALVALGGGAYDGAPCPLRPLHGGRHFALALPDRRGDDGGSPRPREYAAAFARLPELASQHVVGERRLVCLTRLGVEELAKVRPVDALRELLRSDLGDGARRFGSPADDKRSGGGDAALRAFAESYGRAEACAMALAIACGADAGGGGQVDEPATRRAALAAALDLGGRPRFVETATTSASTATQTAPVPALNGGFRVGAPSWQSPQAAAAAAPSPAAAPARPATLLCTFKHSDRHEALLLLASRLLRPVWFKPLLWFEDGCDRATFLLDAAELQALSTPVQELRNALRDEPALAVATRRDVLAAERARLSAAGLAGGPRAPRAELPTDEAARDAEAARREARELHVVYRLVSRATQALALLGVLGRAREAEDRARWAEARDAPPPGAPAGSLLGLLGGPAKAAPKRPATAVDARLKQVGSRTLRELVVSRDAHDAVRECLRALTAPVSVGEALLSDRRPPAAPAPAPEKSGAPAAAAPAAPAYAWPEALARELGGHCYLYFNGGDALAHGASLHLAKAARLTEGLRHAEAEDARAAAAAAYLRAAGAWRSPSDVLPAAAPGASPPALATACDALRVHGCAAAAVEVALACAKNFAPASVPGDAGDAELAGDHWELALYRGRPPDGAQRRDEDAREACHDVALDALKRELWRCGAAGDAPADEARGDGADGALLACCGAKRGPFLDRCLEAAKAADDRRLVKLPLDAVEVYLRAADPGLLWRHHLAHGEDARAAALMEDLATAPGGDLDARVSCLVRAAESARRAARAGGAAAPGASAPPRYDAAKIRELDELLAVARLQQRCLRRAADLLVDARRATADAEAAARRAAADGEPGGEAAQLHDAGLENERALDLERVAATLEERLVGVSELYNDVASRYGMWDLCLVTLKVCGHDDEPLAVKLWTSLLRRLVPRRARDASAQARLGDAGFWAAPGNGDGDEPFWDDGRAASGAFFEDRTWLRPLCDAVASLGRELADDDGELGDAGAADDAPWTSAAFPLRALVALLQRLATLLYETTRAGAADGARPAAPTWPKDALRAAGAPRLALFLALLQVGAARDASDLEKLHALANAADVLDAWATAAANDVRERRAFASGLRHGADPEHLIATLRGFEHTADPLLDKTLNLLHNTRDRVDAIFSR